MKPSREAAQKARNLLAQAQRTVGMAEASVRGAQHPYTHEALEQRDRAQAVAAGLRAEALAVLLIDVAEQDGES